MNKLNEHAAAIQTHPEADISLRWFDPQRSHRLIVLIPANLDWTMITRRIWELARSTDSTVQLISLCNDASQEPTLRRDLVTASALIQDGRVSVEAKVVFGTNWLDAVRHHYQEGDLIVCVAEHTTGIGHRPLSQILESNLKAPVYILSGLASQNRPQTKWLSQSLAWIGSLIIMIAAFLVQIQVISLFAGRAQTTLLIVSLIAETCLIAVWNALLG
jgi:hypothetical protein